MFVTLLLRGLLDVQVEIQAGDGIGVELSKKVRDKKKTNLRVTGICVIFRAMGSMRNSE